MATEQEKQLRRQALAQGYTQGAAKGATFGMMTGNPLFALIGAGVGGQVGAMRNLFQTRGTRSELAELNRRQEMGALGLTDEERAALEQQYMDPQRALMREQIAQGAPQVDDAAIASRMLLGREEQQQKATRQVAGRVAQEDIAEARREEERIQQLTQQMQERSDAINSDITELGKTVAAYSLESQAIQAKLGDEENVGAGASASETLSIMSQLGFSNA